MNTEIIKEDWLYKESKYCSQLRHRWIILSGSFLYCYKNAESNNLTEKIPLKKYKDIQVSNHRLCEFHLKPRNKKNIIRVFVAPYHQSMMEWIECIKYVLHSNRSFSKSLSNLLYCYDASLSSHPKVKRHQTKTDIDNVMMNLCDWGINEEYNYNDIAIDNKKNDNNNDDDIDDDELKYQEIVYNGFSDECKCIEECLSIKGIINILKIYKRVNASGKNNFYKLLPYLKNYKYLLSDYHHILDHHLHQNDNVYDYMMDKRHNLLCDIYKCKIYRRNNAERERILTIPMCLRINDPLLLVFIDILDAIHSHFIHSIDSGLVLSKNVQRKLSNINHNDFEDDGDTSMIAIRTYLRPKREFMEEIRGIYRVSNNKFISNVFRNEVKDENNNKFGERFDFWNNNKPKYCSFKAEMLCNNRCFITLNVFNITLKKAQYFLSSSNKIKQIKSNQCYIDVFGIDKDETLSINNILSLLFYCDFDTLSFNFRSTLQLSDVNMEYFHWSKMLIETVYCFGDIMGNNNINIMYHCVSHHICITSFDLEFNAPSSITNNLGTAALFSNDMGMILELIQTTNIRYFQCSFISCFGGESEMLLIQTPFTMNDIHPLQCVSIRNMKTNRKYTQFIKTFVIFQQMVEFPMKSMIGEYNICVVNDFILTAIRYSNDVSLNDDKWNMFIKWSQTRKYIGIDIAAISGIQLMDDNIDNLLCFDKINMLFIHVEHIECWNIGEIKPNLERYFWLMIDMISNTINELKSIRLYGIKQVGADHWCRKFKKYQALFKKNGWKLKQNKNALLLCK